MGQALKNNQEWSLHPFMEMALAEVKLVQFETEGADRDRCRGSIAT
jgi:hypothetical protein